MKTISHSSEPFRLSDATVRQVIANAIKPLPGVLIMVLSLALPLKAQDLSTNGLVAYYPFAGNANDVWSGLNGELIGNVTPAPDQ